MADDKPGLWSEAASTEGGEILVAPGQVGAFFPDEPKTTRWKDAYSDPDHQPIDVGPNSVCSCGWKGPGWTQHFIETRGGG